MKKVLFFILVLFSAVACKKSSTSPPVNISIIGKWRMTEYLIDIGDGNAKYRPADPSNIIYIEFKADGLMIITPNVLFATNHYEITSDSTMELGLDPDKHIEHYELTPGMLTMYGDCYEACAQRFVPSDQ
jgi:hypothetical protein